MSDKEPKEPDNAAGILVENLVEDLGCDSQDAQARLFRILVHEVRARIDAGSTLAPTRLGRQLLEDYRLNHLQAAREILAKALDEIERIRQQQPQRPLA